MLSWEQPGVCVHLRRVVRLNRAATTKFRREGELCYTPIISQISGKVRQAASAPRDARLRGEHRRRIR